MEREGQRHAGLFLLSLATLLLELSLTRVLSVALWYHFGFLVISTALLGFGAAGVTVASWRWLREEAPLDRAVAWASLAFALTTVGSFWLLQRIPFDPFALLADRRQLLWMPLYDVAIAMPFWCSGLALALLFTRGAAGIGRLYAFDLLGAGAGCAAVAVVMPLAGGSGSVVIAALCGALAAALFALRADRRVAVAGAAVAVACALLSVVADRALPIVPSPGKKAPGADVVLYSAWNTFSKVEVVERTEKDKRWTSRVFFIDGGTAATGMRDLRPDVRAALAKFPADADYSSGVAYVGKAHPRLLILGSGGGSEVLDGLHYGASSITAVEINPLITDYQTKVLKDFWGGLYEQPGVQLVTGEARSYVRRSPERYDAILSAHTISNAAVASGALSLAESYVLTREAFEDYLDHLAPDGVLYFTRPESQIARLFSTAREVFDRRGLGSPAAHLFACAMPPPPGMSSSFGAVFLLKKTPLTADELAGIRARAGSARPGGCRVIYAPDEMRQGSLYHSIATAPDLARIYAAQATLLEPATDDKPFFNQHVRWSGLSASEFAAVFRLKGYREGRMALENRPIAEVTLVAVLVQSALVAALLILLPLWRNARAGLRAPSRFRFLTYFAGLGLGFILVEIALLQRFTLFLGEPVYTLAVVLATLLVGSGAGSWAAGLLRRPPREAVRLAIPLVLAAVAAEALLSALVFRAALGLPLFARVGVAVALIAPLGFVLGMPFPSGLRAVAEETPPLVPWAWGVNCFFTVIGSVSALILGMAFGFKVALALAAGCYLLALASLPVKARA